MAGRVRPVVVPGEVEGDNPVASRRSLCFFMFKVSVSLLSVKLDDTDRGVTVTVTSDFLSSYLDGNPRGCDVGASGVGFGRLVTLCVLILFGGPESVG